jgi:hypothetical protein
MNEACDDTLTHILKWVARVDAATAVAAGPLVCCRWQRLLATQSIDIVQGRAI